MFLCYFANRNEFLRDSSRIEPIPPNIRNDIVSESAMTRRTSRLEKKNLMKPHDSTRIQKKSVRGDSGFVACVEKGYLNVKSRLVQI